MPSNNNNNNNKSPLSSSFPSNPNPRSSEISNPMRRSFTGNPFSKPSVIANPRTNFAHTPANSPSDFPRRSSVGVRESGGSLRDIVDDKENAKDQILKPAKVRSPAAAVASSKTTKNFMSPTISASFKIAESPRKKILSERNEPAPTPTPSSDPKIQVRKVTFADPLEQKRLDASLDGNGIPFPSFEESSEVLSGETTLHDANVVPLIPKNDLSFETMNVPLIPKNNTDLSFETVHDDVNVPLIPVNDIHAESSFETVTQEPDFVNLDPTFKLSPTATPPVSSMATVLAPLDADPLMPPYDPKTNYLSPRPQFLHYRPKPRMELCDQRELEDSFMSGTFSDTDVTEDTQSEGSQKESEDVSSDEIVKQEEDQISEPNSLPEKTVEAKEVPKPRLSVRSKAIALILLLSVAFASISVTNSPGIDLTMFEDFYEAYKSSEFREFARANLDQFSQFAKANFDGLARNLHIWFTKSLSSISELISNVRRANNLAQLQYFNLTVLHDYMGAKQYPIFGGDKNEIGDTRPPVQESDAASEIGTYEYVEDISAEHYEVYEGQLEFEQDIGITTGVENALDAPESEEVLKGQAATMTESEQALQLPEVENLDAKLAIEVDASFNVEEASESEKVLEGQSATWIESEQALQLVEAGNSEENQSQKDDNNSNVENEPSLNSEATEIHNEVCGEDNGAKLNVGKEGDVDLKHWPGSDSEVVEIHTAIYDDEAVGESVSTDAEIKGNEQLLESVSTDAEIKGNEQLLEAIQIPQGMVLYLLLFAGTVCIAGASFNWSRKVKRGSKKIASSVEQPKIVEFPSENNKQISPDKPSLRNGPVEMDVLGESCPSEMSSFENEKSSFYSGKVVNEANSVEKKRKNNHRRESLASSSDYSMGSPSYGSLTMYQKIPKGRGDEEIVTPVRRSSRIRSRATSPV